MYLPKIHSSGVENENVCRQDLALTDLCRVWSRKARHSPSTRSQISCISGGCKEYWVTMGDTLFYCSAKGRIWKNIPPCLTKPNISYAGTTEIVRLMLSSMTTEDHIKHGFCDNSGVVLFNSITGAPVFSHMSKSTNFEYYPSTIIITFWKPLPLRKLWYRRQLVNRPHWPGAMRCMMKLVTRKLPIWWFQIWKHARFSLYLPVHEFVILESSGTTVCP